MGRKLNKDKKRTHEPKIWGNVRRTNDDSHDYIIQELTYSNDNFMSGLIFMIKFEGELMRHSSPQKPGDFLKLMQIILTHKLTMDLLSSSTCYIDEGVISAIFVFNSLTNYV